MRSKLSIFGHPLSYPLLTIGAGLFGVALAWVIAYATRAPEGTFYGAAYWTTIAAFAVGFVAFFLWLGDYVTLTRKSDAFAMASTYTTLYFLTLLCFLAAMLLFIVPGARSGAEWIAVIVLEAVGTGLAAMAWWIGDDMVFRHHIGMVPDTPAEAEAERIRHAPRGAKFISQH